MNAFTRDELYRLVNRTSLPGVDPTEVRVLREYLRRHGTEYDELRFNVRVGEGIKLEGNYTEKFLRDWETRTKMRLDCVGIIRPNQTALIEAKVQWTNDSVWQLLAYRDHYHDEHPEDEIALVGVCEAYTPQARNLAIASDIRLYQYGFPGELPLEPATIATEP